MNRSPLVNVEGELAVPRYMPLDGVPFGREWTVHGTPATASGATRVARLNTTCIDVNAPHRACRWTPSRADAFEPVTIPSWSAATPVSVTRTRRSAFVLCWSLGALGIIGWLIATHEPAPGIAAPLHAAQSGIVTIWNAVRPQPATFARADASADPPTATGQIAIAKPAAAPVVPSRAADTPAPSFAAPRPSAIPRATQRVAMSPPPPRAIGRRSTHAVGRGAAPAVPRVAAHMQPVPHPAARTALPPAYAAAPVPDPLDDPRTLIGMANALRSEQPAVARAARPASDFDWTARLSHRRLTDTPDAFAR